MPLVPLPPLLQAAARDRRGLGAFNVIQLEHAEAIVAGAAQAKASVVLQVSENTLSYHGSVAPLLTACLLLAREAATPVTVHLDHATRPELVHEAVHLGVPSVMYDASALPHDRNVAMTAEVAGWCHQRGVAVEAELGEVGGKDGVHAAGARTDPAEAASYVADTHVDALAVAVGSSHAMLTRDAALDHDLIAQLRRSLAVPLVLHGSSGVPDDGLRTAIAAGMVKINIATHLNVQFTAAVRDRLDGDGGLVDPRKYLGPARDAVADEVARLLGVLGAAGTA